MAESAPPTAPCLTLDEAAQALRISRATIDRMIKRKDLKTVRVASHQRVPASEIDRLLGVGGDEPSRPACAKAIRGPNAKRAKAERLRAFRRRFSACRAKLLALSQELSRFQIDVAALVEEMRACEILASSGDEELEEEF